MKILLVGEYSRLHNSLKEGLIAKGHEVTLIGNGDLFKQYPADINIDPKISKVLVFYPLRRLFFAVFGYDPADHEVAYRFKKHISQLNDFDVIQLINEDALSINPSLQIKLLGKLFQRTKKVFLLCCGDDHLSIRHYLKNEQKYSIMTPYIKDKSLKKQYRYALKYLTKPYIKLHDFIYDHIKGVIATDLDYHITQINNPKYLGLIPNPVNIDKLLPEKLIIKDKINIFHGINKLSHLRKGNIFFEEALKIIQEKYHDRIKITTTYSLPYNEFIEAYNEAHLILDQVYGFDQGYNALEAMAKAKVVFTGAEDIWLEKYHVHKNEVAINAEPDTKQITENLEWLILNPAKIKEISKNARAFIETEHNYIRIAEKYLEIWTTN